MTKRLENRVALVTGASRGIGAAVAERFAREGAHVVLLARTVKELEAVDDRIAAAGGSATILPFDLAKTGMIAQIGPALAEKFGRLDIFVGNAAILGGLSPVALSDPAAFEKAFTVNVFANARLIRTLDPLLRGSSAGRAVFVTSGAARTDAPFWSAYAASKAALEKIAAAWALETAYSGLKVNVVSPGVVRTALRAEAFPGEDPAALPPPESVTDAFVDLAAPDCAQMGRIVDAA